MAYELIISEKPQASKRIAEALADTKAKKETENKVPHYILTHDGKEIVVACAVGHLFGLAEVKEAKKKKGWTYPVFDVEWKPINEIQKSAAFSKKYLDTIKKLAKNANSVTVATDFDVEGEVIGLNCVRFICKKKDANRMKFSTLTKEDLVESYENKLKHLEWGQARAGETRHILDWFWGINLSRALTLAVNKARGGFKLLTSGRVQGPALKLIVDKEKEIKDFVPEPYWELTLKGEKDKKEIDAMHSNGRFKDENEVKKIFSKIKDCKTATVNKIEQRQIKEAPPVPFDLTTLQTQSARYFNIGPKATLNIAQSLYTNGYISYPRTSSQKLPAKLGYKKILNNLSKNPKYANLVDGILSLPQLKPNEGEKTDDAHPSIFPTGVLPKKLNDTEAKIYDLIVKRFLSVFAPAAVREMIKVLLDVEGELFQAEGSRTVEENWYKFYAPYIRRTEVELPKMKEKDKVNVKDISKLDKQTTPPKRYTEAGLVRAMEKENIGTKATRAQIVETLFTRGYIKGKPLEATELGIKTVAALLKHAPDILDVEMTRHFETEMDDIRHGKKKEEEVIDEARETLVKILSKFKKHENEIGKVLGEAEAESYKVMNTLGSCPVCKKGNLMIKKSRFGKFVGCTSYPNCTATFGLPKTGIITVTENVCPECGHPIVEHRTGKTRPRLTCINPKCITWTAEYKEEQRQADQTEKFDSGLKEATKKKVAKKKPKPVKKAVKKKKGKK